MSSAITPVLSAGNSPLFYYAPPSNYPSLEQLLGVNKTKENLLNNRCIAALRVIYHNAMRAGEYLALTEDNVSGYDRVIVPGSKGSASYIITLPGITQQLGVRSCNLTPRSLSSLRYMHLYRACVKAGIQRCYESRRNYARTHIARHDLVLDNNNRAKSRDLSDCLRHRSARTISYYAVKERA